MNSKIDLISSVLKREGPLDMRTLSELTGLSYYYVYSTITKNEHIFEEVGRKVYPKLSRVPFVWNVKENQK